MEELKVIIFDLDGVVIDSEPLHAEAKRQVFDRYGIEVPSSVYTEFKGQTDRDVLTYVAQNFAGNGAEADELIAAKQAVYNQLVEEDLKLIPGFQDFLARAEKEGLRLGLVTSAVRENQERTFARFGLSGRFEAVITAEDVTNAKPDPEPYVKMTERLNTAPAACLVIEDSVNGVHSGKQAGCQVAALTTTFSTPVLSEAGADVVVDGFEALGRQLGWTRKP